MGTIAKGEITLSPVNDAYTVLLTPSSCSISADFDGSNPNLTNAKGTITVKRGTKIVPFKVRQVVYSSAGISVSWPFQEVTTLSFAMTKLANTILDGYVKFQITTQDGFNYTTEVQFSFNVVRESTMLDWIQDWEGSKTKVGGTYIMTPKLFVGKKEAVLDTSGTQPTWKEGALTGVYIGPDLLASGESSSGIYGYLKSQEIFHLNGDGGMIGGWGIDSYGISSKEGRLQILSNGVIRAINAEGDAIWSIGENGEASFAMENVRFYANGDAEFKGKITSQEGSIGGWTIEEGRIYNIPIGISAARKYIAIANVSKLELDSEWGDDHWGWMRGYGGAALYYSASNNFGFVAYGTGGDNLVFSAGSTNCIAGWNFDTEAIWSGDKNNTVKGYATNGITIGSNGLRGIKWYIDANGDVSFMGGKITFSAADNGGEIVGWKLNASRFSTDKITLVSDDANTGLYMSAAANSQFNSRSAASLENFIDSYGGIYLKVKADSADLAAYDLNGKRIFKIKSNGVSRIAGWNFDNATLYTGTAATSGYTNTGEITLGPTGLRGYKWKFENDGSGALAGGKINWDADGNLNVDAQISANNITAGTISTASIQCEGKWALLTDGSGYLASNHLFWDDNGNLTIEGKIVATSGSIAGFKISSGCIGVESSSSSEPGSNSQADWAALTIYKDFFKVGGAKGYVMFGNDVIPSSVGGAFTAVGRIVNNAPNTFGYYGFDQANYGLLINVTGGTKNYGIESNAALKAPAFINTKAKMLTFGSGSYTVDFSQYNIILMYCNQPDYSGTEVTLPTESSVAKQFGLSTLPDDFATIVTFRVRPGSKKIILKGIYNHNEGVQDYEMASGDSITVLISKIDGFRYQILNHSS